MPKTPRFRIVLPFTRKTQLVSGVPSKPTFLHNAKKQKSSALTNPMSVRTRTLQDNRTSVTISYEESADNYGELLSD